MQECFFSSRRLSSAKCIYGAKPRSRFYDAENRLVSCETTAAAVAAGVPKQRLEFAYDWIGRRIQKVVKSWNTTTSSYQVSSDTRFLYDGWNLVAEFNGLASNAVVRTYVWGLDLSGTIRKAGGVGGLLAVTSGGATYFPTFDGNGNVTGLVNAADGTLAAEFEYDPFGNVIKAVGAAANVQPFGFSTRYTDLETGKIMYPQRPYDPSSGRFLCKDPSGEKGGANLYGFVRNNPISFVDPLGLQEADPEAEGGTALDVFLGPGARILLPEPPMVEVPEPPETFNTDTNIRSNYDGEGSGEPYNPIRLPEPLPMPLPGPEPGNYQPDPTTLDLPKQECKECKFRWEGYDAGGYPPHTAFLSKYFLYPLEFGVVVTTPDGDSARFDVGSPNPTPTRVADGKTGRRWSVAPQSRWSPRNRGTLLQDSATLAKEQRVAAKCKLQFDILFDNEVGYRGYQRLLPQFAPHMQSLP